MKETRRHHRIPFAGPIRISWTDRTGEPRYAMGKCLDISESGLRVELPVEIPARTSVSLNAERIKVSGPAAVKRVVRNGGKFVLGLELSQAMHDKAVAAIREPWALRTESPIA